MLLLRLTLLLQKLLLLLPPLLLLPLLQLPRSNLALASKKAGVTLPFFICRMHT